jgi:sec-independent protein translocase protein TatB
VFESVGWGEILVIIVAGLFILGPERLPEAAAWVGKTIRQVREYATGARNQLQSEIGPEFEQFRQPLADLAELRNLDPRRAVSQHLFDGLTAKDLGFDPEDLKLGGRPFEKANGYPSPGSWNRGAEPTPLNPGERPPFDPDAT